MIDSQVEECPSKKIDERVEHFSVQANQLKKLTYI